jgi:hypothetical protein
MTFTQVAEAVRPWVPDIQPLRGCDNQWMHQSLWSARLRNEFIVYALTAEELVVRVNAQKEVYQCKVH